MFGDQRLALVMTSATVTLSQGRELHDPLHIHRATKWSRVPRRRARADQRTRTRQLPSLASRPYFRQMPHRTRRTIGDFVMTRTFPRACREGGRRKTRDLSRVRLL